MEQAANTNDARYNSGAEACCLLRVTYLSHMVASTSNTKWSKGQNQFLQKATEVVLLGDIQAWSRPQEKAKLVNPSLIKSAKSQVSNQQLETPRNCGGSSESQPEPSSDCSHASNSLKARVEGINVASLPPKIQLFSLTEDAAPKFSKGSTGKSNPSDWLKAAACTRWTGHTAFSKNNPIILDDSNSPIFKQRHVVIRGGRVLFFCRFKPPYFMKIIQDLRYLELRSFH